MASKKKTAKGASKRKPKPVRLGRTAAEIYELAANIVGIRDYLAAERAELAQLLQDPLVAAHAGVRAGFEKEMADVDEGRAFFEDRLPADPTRAVAEWLEAYEASIPLAWANRATRWAIRDARLARAVARVSEWLRAREAGLPTASQMNAGYVGAAVATLSSMASARPIDCPEDLERLANHAAVRKARRGEGARKRGGFKDAAIALVALASGLGEQTVKRAARSRRAPE